MLLFLTNKKFVTRIECFEWVYNSYLEFTLVTCQRSFFLIC